MACKLITAPTFPDLQTRLLEDLAVACREHPLAPQWVVVPSATLANHIRVRLAASATDTAYAGVRVVNLPRLAAQLTEALLDKPTRGRDPVLELTLFELVDRLPAQSPLANLKDISGGASLLRQVFTDLAQGGFGPEDLSKVEDLSREPDLARQEQAVLQLFADWVRLLQERGIEWAPLTLQHLPPQIEQASDEQIAVALAAENGQPARLFVYGFYEWIDVHLQWLAALAERVGTTIYYPWHGEGSQTHAAFSFTRSVLDDLRGRINGIVEEHINPKAVGTGNFFLETFPDGVIGKPPEFLSCQRASGSRAEAISAAVRIRRWLDDSKAPLQPEDILVVAPQADEYAQAVQDAFGAFAIPLRISDVSAGPTPADEPLRMLARLWGEQAPTEWVLALLRANPGIPVAEGIDIDTFEFKVRELGIWGGTTWQTALERREFETEDGEKKRHTIQFSDAERRLIGEILEFVSTEGCPTTRLSVADALPKIRRMTDRWLTDAAGAAPLLAATETLARHAPTLKIELRQWTRLLGECAEQGTQRDPLTRAVLFAPLMRSRGLTAKAVVVLGLAAGQLPQRIEDDPVLSENDSAKLAHLAQDIGHRMPLKTRVTEEMLLLFFLINTSAERIHWVVPETDAAGKAIAPTPWVQRYLQRWERTSQGKAKPPEDPFTRRMARSPFIQALHLADLEPQHGAFLPPALALFLDPAFVVRCGLSSMESFLMESVAKRGNDLAWSGGISVTPQIRDNKINVTSLEALARCPFRFYAEKVARWKPLETLSLSHSLDALTRGILLHRLLEQAVKPHLKKKPLGEIARSLLAGEAAALRKLADQLPDQEPDAAFALAMLPPVFRRAAMQDVLKMGIAYFEWAQDSQAIPQQTEEVFRQPFPSLTGWAVTGKVDRLDHLESAVELTDFKSGKYHGSDYRRLIKLGWQIQAALYPWLCNAPSATFQYVFLGSHQAEVGDAEGAPAAEKLLGELAPILHQGAFLPTSNEVMEELEFEHVNTCHYCHHISACRRFEPGAAARHARLFEQLAPQRVASIRDAVAKKTAIPAPAAIGIAARSKPKRGKKAP